VDPYEHFAVEMEAEGLLKLWKRRVDYNVSGLLGDHLNRVVSSVSTHPFLEVL